MLHGMRWDGAVTGLGLWRGKGNSLLPAVPWLYWIGIGMGRDDVHDVDM